MAELDEILALLVENVDGALAAAVAGMDGLIVEQYPPASPELDLVAAELTSLLHLGRTALSPLLGGALEELHLRCAGKTAYVRFLPEELYCLLILEREGNLGKARLQANLAAASLGQVIA